MKVNDIESKENHDALIQSAGGNTFKDLIIDLTGVTEDSAAQGQRAFTAGPGDTFSNVTILGNEHIDYGISIGGTDAENETVTIENCTFQNCGYAIYDSETAQVENLIVTGSTFTGCDYAVLLRAGNGQFTDNTVAGGKLNIMEEGQTITGNVFTDGSRIKFYADPAAFEKNSISADSYLDRDDTALTVDISENYWGGGAPSTEQLGVVTVTGNDVYYVDEDMTTLNTEQSTPGGGGGGSVTRYEVSVPSDVENGTVKVSPARASRGQTVTITVTPDEGYELDTLTVTDADGKAVELTDKGDGKFTFTMPRGKVSISASFKAVEEEPQPSGLPFTDVAEGAWYYDAVSYAYENGLMTGTSATLFAPSTVTSRAMLATLLWRLEGEPTVTGAASFTDVAAGTWYTDAVAWAASEGGVNGVGDGSAFAPNDTITREQMAVMLYRYAQYKEYDVTQGGMAAREYADYESISSWAVPAVEWAVNAGLISGTSAATLSPQGSATRAEIATILMRFVEAFVPAE